MRIHFWEDFKMHAMHECLRKQRAANIHGTSHPKARDNSARLQLVNEHLKPVDTCSLGIEVNVVIHLRRAVLLVNGDVWIIQAYLIQIFTAVIVCVVHNLAPSARR